MGILDDLKSMIEPKATEKVGYQRPAKDGRTNTGFIKPKIGTMGNQNMNKMMQTLEDEEMVRMPKGK